MSVLLLPTIHLAFIFMRKPTYILDFIRTQSTNLFCVAMFIFIQALVACQTAPVVETPREQASDLIREAESSGTIVLVVIALVVAWMILLGFIGRITKVKNS